jgi:hypothetical protein
MTNEPIDLTKLNAEILEALFPSENLARKESENEKAEKDEKAEDEFEIRRKSFFGQGVNDAVPPRQE